MNQSRWLILTVGCSLLGCINGIPLPDTGWDATRLDERPSTAPVAVKVADMDGDGDLDLVSLWRGDTADGGINVGVVAITFQTATGFSTVVIDQSTVYAGGNDLAIGDLNQDGRPDVVVAVLDRLVYLAAPEEPTQGSEWGINDIPTSISADYQAWFSVAIGQIDGEEGPDLVAAAADAGQVVWFQTPSDPLDGEADWPLTVISTDRQLADTVALVDFDGDGLLDVLSSAPGQSSAVMTWHEQPTNLDDDWTAHPLNDFAGATRFVLGDLDNDGDTDIAAVSPSDARAAWIPQPANPEQRWTGYVLADFNIGLDDRVPFDVVLGDIDNDGQNDLVIATNQGLSWFTPGDNIQARWTETSIVTLFQSNPGLFDLADLDSDGRLDVLVPIDHDTDRLDRINQYSRTGT